MLACTLARASPSTVEFTDSLLSPRLVDRTGEGVMRAGKNDSVQLAGLLERSARKEVQHLQQVTLFRKFILPSGSSCCETVMYCRGRVV